MLDQWGFFKQLDMKRLIIGILIITVMAGLYGFYLYNKKPVDTREQNPDFELTSAQIVKEFSDDEQAASKKYNDKIVLVSGKINEINLSSSTVFLDASDAISAITCSFYADESSQLKTLKVGDVVKIKGKCTGKLTDVIINNCRISD
jgi:lysyl-tRNA synthetase class II